MTQRASQPATRPGATIGWVLSDEQFPAPMLVGYGAAAEQAGFDAVWSSDHLQPWQDNEGHGGLAWLTLAALGQRTERLIMGTGVTCPSFRYQPAVVAQAFATLGLFYPGRVFLGVGTGEALNEQAATGEWGDYQERAARLAEAVGVIRRLWTGEVVNHDGPRYTLTEAKLYDLPPQPVPIYVAASGPKSMHLAGELGDGLITDGQTALRMELRQAFEAGARSVGKDPATMAIVCEHWVIVGDEAEARRYAPLWQFLPQAWKTYVNDPSPRSIERRARQDVPIEQVLAKWTISPDPRAHVQQIQRLLDAGVTHVMVHSPQPDQRRMIEFFGREVLPQLRHRQQDRAQPWALPTDAGDAVGERP